MNRLAVILPAYNEELTIEGTIQAFSKALPHASIWVIDNRSSDSTCARAQQALREAGCEGGVIEERRPGKGNAVRRAFLEVDADIYVLADADLTYPAEQVQELMAPVLEGRVDMSVGDRRTGGHYAAENKRPLHGFGNALVCRLVNLLFRAKLSDIMSGYRVFNRRFVKSYPVLAEGFDLETDMTLHALDKRFRIAEIPVAYRDRPEGSYSKLNTVRDGFKVLATIGNILRFYRPLFFFGALGGLSIIGGLAAAAPVLHDWFTLRFINHVPLAILATGLEIVGIVFLAIGLIMDSINHQDRRRFEMDMLRQSPD